MSDREAEFREFVGARMESLRGLAYLTCGDWQVAEDAVLGTLGVQGTWFSASAAFPPSGRVGGP